MLLPCRGLNGGDIMSCVLLHMYTPLLYELTYNVRSYLVMPFHRHVSSSSWVPVHLTQGLRVGIQEQRRVGVEVIEENEGDHAFHPAHPPAMMRGCTPRGRRMCWMRWLHRWMLEGGGHLLKTTPKTMNVCEKRADCELIMYGSFGNARCMPDV